MESSLQMSSVLALAPVLAWGLKRTSSWQDCPGDRVVLHVPDPMK